MLESNVKQMPWGQSAHHSWHYSSSDAQIKKTGKAPGVS